MDDKVRCSPDAERKQAAEHKYAAHQSSVEQYHRGLLHTKSVFLLVHIKWIYLALPQATNILNSLRSHHLPAPRTGCLQATFKSASVHASNAT